MKVLFWCPRCGENYATCVHSLTDFAKTQQTNPVTNDEAERIRARYAFGRRHNPDHDETSYRDPQ